MVHIITVILYKIHVIYIDDYEEIYRGQERQIKKNKTENTWAIIMEKS